MNCQEVRDWLVMLGDETCPAEVVEAVRRHLTSCPACAAEGEAIERTARLIADLDRLEAPAELWERIWTRIRAEESLRLRRRGRLRRLGAALIPLAAALLLAGVLLRSRPSREAASPGEADLAALIQQHYQLDNESVLGGDETLAVECALPPEAVEGN